MAVRFYIFYRTDYYEGLSAKKPNSIKFSEEPDFRLAICI